MNKLNFNQSIGFPFETNILDEMQKAYTLFNALGAIVGNFSIIAGCELNGSTIADGVVFINGEILEFKGGVAQTNVIVVEEKTALEFEDTNSHDVIFTRYATFGTATTQWPWADFKRGMPTIDIAEALAGKATTQALTALSNSIQTMLTKLDTIDENAKVQVQTDWNATGGLAELLNKPNFSNPFLYKGVYVIGDVSGSDISRTVTFPSVGTSEYFVLGSLRSDDPNWDKNNDVFETWGIPTESSFKLYLREVASNVQDLKFHYLIIPI
jgi:hypothetical protein